jgi:beta-lactamase class A
MNRSDQTPYHAYYYASPRRNATPARTSPKPPKRHRGRRLLVSCLVLGLVGIGAYALLGGHAKTTLEVDHPASPLKRVLTVVTKKPSGPSAASLATMSQQINSIISQNSAIDISVNLIDLDNNQAEHYGVNETFQAASTAKILTAAYFLHQVEVGQESLNETINSNTAQYELQQMIVVSDDTAWAALDTDLGYTNLQDYAATLGITDYQAYNNVLSSGDIALTLQKLWDGSLLNSTDTQLLLSYMKQANYRQYIVPAVPSDDTIYHKIGLYQDNVHDAAIITDGQHAFVIVIFTNGNGTYNWPGRATIMQNITKPALSTYFGQ